jgi:hypothetical protein
VHKADFVIVIGTPRYCEKYENNEPLRGFVVAAEGDLIGDRMIGTEARKETVLPVLLEGNRETAFPPMLRPRVYADFLEAAAYFAKALDLALDLYKLLPRHPLAIDLRESLCGPLR